MIEDIKGVIRIEEEQKIHWPKNKQRSTKHKYKTKDRVTRTPLKLGVNSSAPEGLAVLQNTNDYTKH